MTNPFVTGDVREHTVVVSNDKLARFDAGLVHAIYSTFALAQDAEWSGRLFVLEMKEEGEEGIGTYISVRHVSSALAGSRVRFVSEFVRLEGNAVHTRYRAFVGERLVAEGEQEQRIVRKAKLQARLDELTQ